MSVVNRFFSLEFDEHIRELLLDAIEQCEAGCGLNVHAFEFNLYNVTIDRQKATAKVDDILDPSEDGEETWLLSKFADAVRSHTGVNSQVT